MEEQKEIWYRRGQFHEKWIGQFCVERLDFKSINKAKKANRVTQYRVRK